MFRLLLLFLSGGATLMALALPALLRMVRPNSVFGVCAGAALSSPARWYEINQAAGWRLFKAGLATAVAAIGLYFLPGLSAGGYYAVCSTVMILMLLACLFKTARHLNHYQSR